MSKTLEDRKEELKRKFVEETEDRHKFMKDRKIMYAKCDDFVFIKSELLNIMDTLISIEEDYEIKQFEEEIKNLQ